VVNVIATDVSIKGSARFGSLATHARTLLPAALASAPFGFVLVRVRVRGGLANAPDRPVRRHVRQSPMLRLKASWNGHFITRFDRLTS